MSNPIISNQAYTNIESNQNIYIRIDDTENDLQYFAVITLSSISC